MIMTLLMIWTGLKRLRHWLTSSWLGCAYRTKRAERQEWAAAIVLPAAVLGVLGLFALAISNQHRLDLATSHLSVESRPLGKVKVERQLFTVGGLVFIVAHTETRFWRLKPGQWTPAMLPPVLRSELVRRPRLNWDKRARISEALVRTLAVECPFEDFQTQVMCGETLINRARAPGYPSDVHKVAYAPCAYTGHGCKWIRPKPATAALRARVRDAADYLLVKHWPHERWPTRLGWRSGMDCLVFDQFTGNCAAIRHRTMRRFLPKGTTNYAVIYAWRKCPFRGKRGYRYIKVNGECHPRAHSRMREVARRRCALDKRPCWTAFYARRDPGA